MDILFVYTEIPNEDKQHYYAGLGSIIALLESCGHRVSLLHFTRMPQKNEFFEKLRGSSFSLVGFTCNWLQWRYVSILASWLKEYADVPVILGGCMPTFEPHRVLADPNVDFVCRGEGEFPMLDLADRLERGGAVDSIPNIWTRRGSRIIENSMRELISDLDILPKPAKEQFNYARLLNKTEYTATVSAGRGCHGACSFCINDSMRSIHKGLGKWVRKHSPAYVIEETKSLVTRYRVKRIFFEDENFSSDPEWLSEFGGRYAREIGVPFMVGLSMERTSREVLEILHRAGCRWVGYGVETGNEELRRQVLKKRAGNREIIELFRLTKSLGISPIATVMTGIPGETIQTVCETIDFLKEIRPLLTLPFMYFPLPGTRLYEDAQKQGLISDRPLENMFDGTSVLNLPGLPQESMRELWGELVQTIRIILIEEVPHGYLSFCEELVRSFGGFELQDARIDWDWWKNIFDTSPVVLFTGSGRVEASARILPGTKFIFGIGFYRQDEHTGAKGRITYKVSIAYGKDCKTFEKIIHLDGFRGINLHYEYYEIDLSNYGEFVASVELAVKMETGENPINVFWINPYFEQIAQ